MRGIGALAVAGTYIGTVIGAGFASGQEILRFFSLFGPVGAWGILLAVLLFALFGARILMVGSRVGASSHRPVLRAVAGRRLGSILDALVSFFLFGSLSTMTAAAGAALHETWRLPAPLGSLVMAGAAAGTVLAGGAFKAISRVSPLLIAATVALAAATTGLPSGGAPAAATEPSVPPVVPWWPLAAVLYVSFNLVGAVAVLAPLGGSGVPRRALASGAVLGAAGLGLAAASIHWAIVADLGVLQHAEVPMVRVAAGVGPRVAHAYGAVLLLEVYTTAVASLFGLAARLRGVFPGGYAQAALAGAAGALFAGRLGFVSLVATLYPLVGAAGLILLVCLAIPRRVPPA